MVNASRKPHFLEVFLPALCSERLKVPTRFIRHLAGRISGSILLTGPSDNSWHVDLIEHNGHLFFDHGWSIFVKDHSIECGDSLVFRYDGNSHFSVQIFDQSSCEKEEAFLAKCSQETSNINECLGKKRERGREAATSNAFVEKKMRGELRPAHIDFPGGDRYQELQNLVVEEIGMNGYDNKMLDLLQFQTSEGSIVLGLPASSDDGETFAIKMPNRNKIASKVNIACSNNSNMKKAHSKTKKMETQKKSSISEFIEAKAAHYFSSSFPYFVRVMKYSNIVKGSLKVPAKFAKDHLPNCRTKVIVRNLDGDCWVLNSVPTAKLHSTAHSFCGGWSAFIRCNGIKMEDVCIFELVDKLEMRVHILRLGLEGLESQTQKGSSDVYGERAGGPTLQIAEYVPEDNEAHPLKISEETDDQNINSNMEHKMDSDMIPGTEEVEYFFDTSDNASALNSPFERFPLSRVPGNATENLPACNADGTTSYRTSIESGAELYATPGMKMPLTAGDERVAHSFTSPFPNFMKVMMRSDVKKSTTLNVPRKFSDAHFPKPKTEIVLRNLRGDCWNVASIRYGHQTKWCRGWSSFVHHNGVKVGDICIFELIDDRFFQVHIFSASHVREKSLSNDAMEDYSTGSMEFTPYARVPEA